MKRHCLHILMALTAGLLLAACGESDLEAALPDIIPVPAGPFIAGSDRAERQAAYALDEAAYGHSVTREQGWYENEDERHSVTVGAFAVMASPVTNRLYGLFIAESAHPAPDVDQATWTAYGLVHSYKSTRRFAWVEGVPPKGREDHPVTLVAHADALAFAAWLSQKTGQRWRLPSALEWEKAVRGTEGRIFPWGDGFDPDRLNSHDAGPFDTVPVGRHPGGAGPFGLTDAAGQVFEWTADPAGSGRYLVKGGSWDDKGCGICRPAAHHARPADIKHILIGFRLVRD